MEIKYGLVSQRTCFDICSPILWAFIEISVVLEELFFNHLLRPSIQDQYGDSQSNTVVPTGNGTSLDVGTHSVNTAELEEHFLSGNDYAPKVLCNLFDPLLFGKT